MDLNLMRRDIGQTILAAGMSDDTIGWILLSIVARIAAGDAVSVGSVLQTVGSVLAFLVISFTAGRWFVLKAINFVQDEMVQHDRLLTPGDCHDLLLWGAIHPGTESGSHPGRLCHGYSVRLPRPVCPILYTRSWRAWPWASLPPSFLP